MVQRSAAWSGPGVVERQVAAAAAQCSPAHTAQCKKVQHGAAQVIESDTWLKRKYGAVKNRAQHDAVRYGEVQYSTGHSSMQDSEEYSGRVIDRQRQVVAAAVQHSTARCCMAQYAAAGFVDRRVRR